MIPIETLIYAKKAGTTRRYHTQEMIQHQSVAAHSHSVAMICYWLAGQEAPGISPTLLMAALTHDMAEVVMGDMPGPTKRMMPPLDGIPFRAVWGDMEQKVLNEVELDFAQYLTPEEERILNLADAADGCLHCIQERAMGNALIYEVWVNFIAYYCELVDREKTHEIILRAHLMHEWEKYHGA